MYDRSQPKVVKQLSSKKKKERKREVVGVNEHKSLFMTENPRAKLSARDETLY